jgi:hypothetical protein
MLIKLSEKGHKVSAMPVVESPTLRINGEVWTLDERRMEARLNNRPHDAVRVTRETMGRLKVWAREKVEVTYQSGRFSRKF